MSLFADKFKKMINFLGSSDGNLNKKIVRSGIWVGISNASLNMLSFVRTIILVRLLLPSDFGLMGICLIVTRGIEIFTETGFGAALIHRQNKFEEAKDTTFTLMVIRGIVLSLIIIIIAPFIADYYEESVLGRLIRVFALSFFISGFNNINVVVLQKELDFRRLTYVNQARRIMEFLITVTLAYFLRNVWALVFGHVFASIVGVILSYKIIHGKMRFFFDKQLARELFAYGKFITGLSIVVFLSSEIATAILGKLLGMEYLGYYVLAFTIAGLPTTHISKIISRVMFPAYSKLQNDLPALRRTCLDVLKLVAHLAIPASVGIAVLAPEFVRVLYGECWMPVVGPLQILCIFGGVMAIGSMNGYVFNAIGKPYIPFYLVTARLSLTLLIIYPLIKKFGLIGAAIAVTVPLVLQFLVSTIIFSRAIELKISKIVGTLSIVISYSFIMALIVYYCKQVVFSNVNFFNLTLLIITGILSYAILNYKEVSYIYKKRLMSALR